MNYSLPEAKFNVEFLQNFLESNILLYCIILLLALKIITVAVSINFPQNIFFADITRASLENFANQTRQSVGLPSLVENQKLDQAAQSKAENMVADDYFAHTSPQGITPWYWFLQAGYNYKYAGENLAIGFFDSQEVYNAWLNSPSHKANIVNPNYKEVGTAVLAGFGPNNTIVVVQDFGSQLPAKQVATQPKQTSAVKPSEQTPVANAGEKVLSQSTESQSTLETAKTGSSNVYSKIMNSVLYNYGGLLQDIIYGVSLVVIGILLALIFFNASIPFENKLVFRSVLIVILLSLATLLNKGFIVAIIPYQIII